MAKKPSRTASGSSRKRAKDPRRASGPDDGVATHTAPRASALASTPIHDLLRNFERAPDQWAARYIILFTSIIVRAAVGLAPHLGQGTPPLYGDFEAQRHWMELTSHLPLAQWYRYDLPYWGLDYPPLTAYHLWVCGKIGALFNLAWFALDTSRGLELLGITTFMRLSSLVSETVTYIPAVLAFVAYVGKQLNVLRMDQLCIAATVLCQPLLILIDHGHFQYNSVMLGFFVFSLTDLCQGNVLLASVWFVAAVCFKQMALYYAPFIFCHLLASCLRNRHDAPAAAPRFDLRKLVSIGITTVLTFAAILLPFVLACPSTVGATLLQILHRCFPFQRGIFEDKVANFWCTTNLVVKYRLLLSQQQLTRALLALTLAAIAPPCAMIVHKNLCTRAFLRRFASPDRHLALVYGFAATAWGFYMFLFQVHEKTVLVPLIPSSLLYVAARPELNSMCLWINNIAVYSMWPLLRRDGLALQYCVLIYASNFLAGAFLSSNNTLLPKHRAWKAVHIASYAAAVIVHVIELLYPPPARYPDLWVILNTTLSFGCFGLFWLWLLYKLYRI